MEIYLAARYSRLDELSSYAADLRALGHTVEARWLLGNQQLHEGADYVEAAIVSVPLAGRPFARDDYEDVRKADNADSLLRGATGSQR